MFIFFTMVGSSSTLFNNPAINQLLVFPGLSSPYGEKQPVYDLLRSRAKDLDVEVTIALYPGQQSENGGHEGAMTAQAAFDSATELLRDFAKKDEPFITLGISLGCTVSLVAATQLQGMHLWKRAVIWGPIPHYLMCRTFIENRNPNLGKGTRFAEVQDNVYLHANPIEQLLADVRLPVDVGIGGSDNYVHREYLQWLQKLCESAPKPPYRNFVYLEGCGHNVTASDPNHTAYLDFIFGAMNRG